MKKNLKNIVMIVIIILMIGAIIFTGYYAKNNLNSFDKNMQGESIGNGKDNNMAQPPEMPSGSSSDSATVPEKPDSSSSDSSTTQDKPSKTMEMPSGQMTSGNHVVNTSLTVKYYILFGVESLVIALCSVYLYMSRMNKKNIKQTFGDKEKIIIYILSTIIITIVLTVAEAYTMNSSVLNTSNITDQTNTENGSNDSSSVTAKGEKEITTDELIVDDYETKSADTSILLVKNGGNLSLTAADITKTSGDSTNTENSEFYGINSGILVTAGSTATIKNSTITTNAVGSNAVFSTGTDSVIKISDSTITTTGKSSSRGLDATYGGYIDGSNLTIKTSGGSCAALATDKGEGTITVDSSKLETNGSGSPVIYSTGNISITNTTGTANNSQMVVIEGKNSATVDSSKLYATAAGNRGTTDEAGIMIYQSMSGDASTGTGTFTATNSSLNILSTSSYYKTAPMFFITNTDAVINLTNNKINYGSNILVSIKGTSEWGTSGSNGGTLELNATKQSLVGNITVDKISTLKLSLKSLSSYKGTINSENTAKSISITLDKSSKITLTGNSYVSSLTDEDTTYSNINFNGYKLYVDGKSIK